MSRKTTTTTHSSPKTMPVTGARTLYEARQLAKHELDSTTGKHTTGLSASCIGLVPTVTEIIEPCMLQIQLLIVRRLIAVLLNNGHIRGNKREQWQQLRLHNLWSTPDCVESCCFTSERSTAPESCVPLTDVSFSDRRLADCRFLTCQTWKKSRQEYHSRHEREEEDYQISWRHSVRQVNATDISTPSRCLHNVCSPRQNGRILQ